MSKKIKKLSTVLLVLTLLVGCQNKESLQDTAEAFVEVKEDSANVEAVTIEKDRIKIKYPKLVHLENEKIEAKWNTIIEDRISKDLELLAETDVYNLDYEVATNTKEELSLKLIGSCYYDGAAQPFHFIYTYNISLTTGESIRLSDQRDIAKLATMIYNKQGFQMESNIDVDEEFMKYIYSTFENEELLAEMLINFDYDEETQQQYGYSFFEHNQLHLCIEVPHDLGDYVILSLDTEK